MVYFWHPGVGERGAEIYRKCLQSHVQAKWALWRRRKSSQRRERRRSLCRPHPDNFAFATFLFRVILSFFGWMGRIGIRTTLLRRWARLIHHSDISLTVACDNCHCVYIAKARSHLWGLESKGLSFGFASNARHWTEGDCLCCAAFGSGRLLSFIAPKLGTRLSMVADRDLNRITATFVHKGMDSQIFSRA